MIYLILIIILVYIYIKYRPGFDIIKNEHSTSFMVFYSIKTNKGFIRREFFELFNLKNNDW